MGAGRDGQGRAGRRFRCARPRGAARGSPAQSGARRVARPDEGGDGAGAGGAAARSPRERGGGTELPAGAGPTAAGAAGGAEAGRRAAAGLGGRGPKGGRARRERPEALRGKAVADLLETGPGEVGAAEFLRGRQVWGTEEG